MAEEETRAENNPATDYGAFVVGTLNRMTQQDKDIDQRILRQCLGLSSSYLITDGSMNREGGLKSWYAGFSRLVEVVVALHQRDELELETVNAASKACSECWSVVGSWRGFEDCRDGVREVAGKLKKLLDENGRSYKGEQVYAP